MIQGGVRTSPQSVAFPGGSRSSRRAPGGPVCPGGGAPWRRGFGGGGSGPRRGLSSLPGAAEVYGRNRGFGRLRGDPYVSPSPAGGRLSRRRGGGLYRPLAAGPLRPPPHDAEPPEALRLHPASFTSWGARTRLLSPPPTGPHTPNRREGVCRGTLPAGDRYMVASRHDRTKILASPRDSRSASTTATASRTIRPRSTASPCSPRRTRRACSRSISSSADTYTVIFSSCRSRPLGRRFAPRPRRRAGTAPPSAASADADSCRRRPFGAAASAPRPPCSAGAEPSGSSRRGFDSSPREGSVVSAGPPGAGTRGASPLTAAPGPPAAAAGPPVLRGAGDCSPDPPVVRNNSSAPGRLTRRDTGRAPPWPVDGRRRHRRSWTRTW